MLYLPSYCGTVISRNEFEIYMAIGLPKDIVRPYGITPQSLASVTVTYIGY